MDTGLKGVHVLVTGASGGIGLAVVQTFLDQGSKVTAHYNSNKATLEPILSQSTPGSVQAGQADLTKEADVARLFDEATSTFGPVHVLIINHAIYCGTPAPVADMSLEQWSTTITANLTSSFLVAREFLSRLRGASAADKDHAAIVLVGSTAGKYGEANHSDYAASKSAMMYGFTMSLKNEIVKIAPKGRVNCVGPGWVRTPMAEEALKNPNIIYSALASTPLKKVAVPQDVANQIVILSSGKLSGHITGQVVMIEGGMEGRLLNTREDVGLEA